MKKIYSEILSLRLMDELSLIYGAVKKVNLSKVKKSETRLSPGEVVFSVSLCSGIAGFYCIRPMQGEETFSLDIGWSTDGKFNPLKPVVIESDLGRREFNEKEAYLHLNMIEVAGVERARVYYVVWKCSESLDSPSYDAVFLNEYFSPVDDVLAKERVESVLSSALSDIRNVAVPYLKELMVFKEGQSCSA